MQADARQAAFLVAKELEWRTQIGKIDAFRNRMFNLFFTTGHLGFSAAIDDGDFRCAKAQGDAGRIEGGVTAAENAHSFVEHVEDGCIHVRIFVRLHKVHARQEFIGGIDSHQ